jgi:hypothetical protein
MSPNNEWSGILFYKVEGDFDSPEFKIICEDIYLMDIGFKIGILLNFYYCN